MRLEALRIGDRVLAREKTKSRALGRADCKRQRQGDPTGVCERGSRKNQERKARWDLRASDVTELQPGEQWGEDAGFSLTHTTKNDLAQMSIAWKLRNPILKGENTSRIQGAGWLPSDVVK